MSPHDCRQSPAPGARRSAGAVLVLGLGLAGCGPDAAGPRVPPPADTGSAQVARLFFEAVLREDWAAAYDTLDAKSKAWCGKDPFAALGRGYLKQIDFTPTGVNVSTAETGDRATAIASFHGSSGTSPRSYKDGTSLKKTGSAWAVVLNKSFGKEPPAPAKAAAPGRK